MENTSDDNTEKTSFFNSGVAQIRRLDELWTKIHVHAQQGDLTKWNWGLDRIWCELVGDIPEDESNGVYKDTKEENKKETPTDKFIHLNLKIGEIKKRVLNKEISIPDSQIEMYNLLMEKEAFIRRLQNKQGKGTKLVDADEDMVD